MELIIRNAKIWSDTVSRDIGISDGKIEMIVPRIESHADEEIDAKGLLVCPGFVDAHLHLDKVLISNRYRYINRPKIASEHVTNAILEENKLKKQFTVEDVAKRANAAIRMAVAAGTTRISAMVDIDHYEGLIGLRGVLEAARQSKDLVDLQVIAFPQNGIVCSPGVEDMLRQAVREGANVLGGLPDLEKRPEEQVDILFDIAKQFRIPINTHIDQTRTPTPYTLPYLAQKTVAEGYQGKVAAAHCINLSVVPIDQAKRTLDAVKEADISICFNPKRLLIPGSRELLMESGVNLALITDNMMDVWNAFGNGDQMLNALIVAISGYSFAIEENDFNTVMALITHNAARAVGIQGYGIKEGNQADLVVLDATSPYEAIVTQRRRRFVIKRGKVVARDGAILPAYA